MTTPEEALYNLMKQERDAALEKLDELRRARISRDQMIKRVVAITSGVGLGYFLLKYVVADGLGYIVGWAIAGSAADRRLAMYPWGLLLNFVGTLLVGIAGYWALGGGYQDPITWTSMWWGRLWLFGWFLLAMGFAMQLYAAALR